MPRASAIAIVAAALGGLVASAACSSDGTTGGSTSRAVATQGRAPTELAAAHLLAHGARRATADHPSRRWFRGDLLLPAGGPSCAVAGITSASHAPLIVDAVFDPSGTIAVRIRATERDHAACLDAAARALEGLEIPADG